MVANHAFEHHRSVAEVVGRDADVGPHRLLDQGGAVAAVALFEERLHRRANPVHDRTEVAGPLGGVPRDVIEGGRDRAAVGVPHHHHEAGAELLGGELDARHLGGGHDVAGHPDHEQVAEALVKDDLGGHPGIGAAEDDREGVLAGGHFLAPRGEGAPPRLVGGEAAVPVAKLREGIEGGEHAVR